MHLRALISPLSVVYGVILCVFRYLDFISVRTFDLHGDQDRVTAHHSPIYSENNQIGLIEILLFPFLSCQDYVMQHLMERGAPAGKLLLGCPTHVRSFTLSTTATGLGAPVSRPASPGPYTQQIGVWSYYETCSFLKGTSVEWINDQKVPYAVKSNQWVGFDNQRSYDAKLLCGHWIWMTSLDSSVSRANIH
uniref:GH18 domain-containing protein n=1 Tax=Dicentrarchus labrax TaxID=13489 RepID=A0A8P4GL07_DICLA